MYIAIALAGLLVGIILGTSGIGGFLLPIFFTGVLGFKISDSMAISFSAFIVSGIIGSYFCYKSGDIDLKIAYKMGIGAILGALIGVLCNNMVSTVLAKSVLYIMVLISGLLLFVRIQNKTECESVSPIMNNSFFLIVIGFLNALICSFSGASGTVLLVPLLSTLGVNVKVSVGISLFNQIFISLVASLMYQRYATLPNIHILIIICIVFHGLGIMLGAKLSGKIKAALLRNFVAVVSILFSSFMLFKLF